MSHTKPIQFPQDEQKHNFIVEWWYFNGHVQDKKGNHYSYMYCLFKADAKKINLPFFDKQPYPILYFAHSLLTDHQTNKFYPDINYISLLSKDSFTKPLLYINFINPNKILNGFICNAIEETKPLQYEIKSESFALQLKSAKKPLLENQKGWIEHNHVGSYYYSLTNLKTKGFFEIDNKKIEVTGKSWFDHQWANSKYNPAYSWTWFCIQLDNNIELVVMKIQDSPTDEFYLSTIMFADGKQNTYSNVHVIPGATKWKSPITKAEYPISWKIEIPEEKIYLDLEPIVKEQEMLFGVINYWEGPLRVSGKMKGKKITGKGFLELVGYKKGVTDLVLYEKELFAGLKNKISDMLQHKHSGKKG